MTLAVEIFGWLATICMLGGYMPQAIHTIRTRDTSGIAWPTFISLGLGSVFFALQGLLMENWPLLVANTITAICSAIITGIKLYNRKR